MARSGKIPDDELKKIIGTNTDEEIAKKLGMTKQWVNIKRRILGIPSFATNEGKIEWTNEAFALLGNVNDKEIAKLLDCSVTSVYQMRKSRGIAPHRRRKAEKTDEWESIKQLPQGELFSALRELHNASKPKLTHKRLAELTGYSLSRIQKWMTPGSAQEPLSPSIRHHIFLCVKHQHAI